MAGVEGVARSKGRAEDETQHEVRAIEGYASQGDRIWPWAGPVSAERVRYTLLRAWAGILVNTRQGAMLAGCTRECATYVSESQMWSSWPITSEEWAWRVRDAPATQRRYGANSSASSIAIRSHSQSRCGW